MTILSMGPVLSKKYILTLENVYVCGYVFQNSIHTHYMFAVYINTGDANRHRDLIAAIAEILPVGVISIKKV